MAFLHLFIVNKSGSLIHHRPLSDKAPKIDINEWLRIGSTFHSLHAIAAEASPLRLPNNKNYCTFHVSMAYYYNRSFVLFLSVTFKGFFGSFFDDFGSLVDWIFFVHSTVCVWHPCTIRSFVRIFFVSSHHTILFLSVSSFIFFAFLS